MMSEKIKEHYQRQFSLKSFGFPTSAYKPLFSGKGRSFPAALRECTEFCRGDRRCIGMEVCQIREDLYRCRACCEWMKLGEKTEPTNNMAACKYYEMKEETMNIAVSQPATLSSTYSASNYKASNANDNVLKCSSGLSTACSQLESQPWLKIDLQAIYDVNKVTIYNRQDCCGERLHDVQINIINNGTDASCGFYKGPADDGDRISVYCASGAVGRRCRKYCNIKVCHYEFNISQDQSDSFSGRRQRS
uniref:Fucolectin tachylectin-4 pentraxin-1 domain-containing protein n=1 Tax=Magallana gigas TaxID=29159 RepID=A0A8W8J7F7_MAGGI